MAKQVLADRAQRQATAAGYTGYHPEIYTQQYEDYLASIQDLKGTSYYDTLLNHSGAQFQAYEPGWLENTFGSERGVAEFYTNRFASAYQAADQARDALRQEKFNLPAAELQRRQAAGINDALNGGQNVGSGSTPDGVSDSVPPSAIGSFGESGPADATSPFSLADAGMNFISGCLSFASSLYDLGFKNIQNAGSDLALLNDAYDYTVKTEGNREPLPTKEDGTVDYSAVPDYMLDSISVNGRAKGKLGRTLLRARGLVSYSRDGKLSTPLRMKMAENAANYTSNVVKSGTNMAVPGYADDPADFAAAYGKIMVDNEVKMIQTNARIREIDERIALLSESLKGTELKVAEGTADAAIAQAGSEANLAATEARVASATAGSRISEAESMSRSAAAQAGYNEGALTNERGSAEAKAVQIQKEIDTLIGEIDKAEAEVWESLSKELDNYGFWGKVGHAFLPSLRQDVHGTFERKRAELSEKKRHLRNLADDALVGTVTKAL